LFQLVIKSFIINNLQAGYGLMGRLRKNAVKPDDLL